MLIKKALCMVMVLLICTVNTFTCFGYSDTDYEQISSLEDFAEKCPQYDIESLTAPEEFANEGEYLNYLQEKYEEYMESLSGGDLNIGEEDPDDILVNNSPTYGFHFHAATPVYKLMNLPSTGIVQKCYVTGSNIYTVQVPSGDTIYLSKCQISNDGIHAYYQSHMVLNNVGSDQTLEMFTYNDNTYFWIGLKSYHYVHPETLNDFYYTTQIGRIQYQGGTTINNYTQVPRFGNLNYANDSNTNLGTVMRMDAALSTDGTKLMLAVRNDTDIDGGYAKVQYSVYSTSVLNQKLDQVEANPNTNMVSFKNNTALQAVCEPCFTQVGNQRVFPNGSSCQGLELTNTNYSIYMASGYAPSGHTPRIGKMVNTGTVSSPNYIYHSCLELNNTEMQPSSTEIEGVQIRGDYLYFVLTHINESTLIQNYSSFNFPNDPSSAHPQYVYKINKGYVTGDVLS